MEERLGHDLHRVRVHDDAQAARATTDVGARAWAVGHQIAFGAGEYRPGTSAGDRLLAHELAHTLQGDASPGGDIPIGAVDDPAEREAERMADQVLGAASAMARRPMALRRQLDPAIQAELPERARGESFTVFTIQEGGPNAPTIHMDVRRRFERCPCRNVPEAVEGAFYDVTRNRLAIAYRHCEGRATSDVYAEVEGDPGRLLSGRVPVTSGRFGVEINLAPRRGEGGRVILEGVGEEGPAAGGHALLVYENGSWRVYVDAEYRRRLGALAPGQAPDDVDISLGGQWGRVRARLQATDLASARPGVRLETCVDVGIGPNLCGWGEAGGERGPGAGVGVQIPWDIPGGGRPERCFTCYCPPARPVYECQRYTFPWIEEKTEPTEVTEEREFRFYFRLDRTTPAEDPALRAQSEANITALQQRVTRDRATILDVVGYASPEASERHNSALSETRARAFRERLSTRLGADVAVPEGRGGGELLGSRPSLSPSSHLGEVITEHGFRKAEDLTVLLLGEEIPNRELADQFLSLFGALTEPADRLALFGLTGDDPIAPRVLAAVEQFVAARGRGPRPWERVFRPLRVAVARAAWTEERMVTTQTPHGSRRDPVTGTECEGYAQRAVREKRFTAIEPRDLVPHVDAADRNAECRDEPTGREPRDCDYRIPPALRRPLPPLTAPGRAPRPLP